MDTLIKKAMKIMQLLEMNCGVYDLEIYDIPIWWFIRVHFFYCLVNFLGADDKDTNLYQGFVQSKKDVSIRRINWKSGIICVLRSIVGFKRFIFNKFKIKEPILFLTHPHSLRGQKDGKKIDVYFDSTYNRFIDKSVIVERLSLKNLDFYSLLFRKNVIFLDWAMIWATIRFYFTNRKFPEIRGWNEFKTKCNRIEFEKVSAGWVIDTIKKLVHLNKNMVSIKARVAEIIINNIRPRIIIETTSYDSDPMAFNLLAKKRGIPIIEFQHGVIHKFHLGYCYFTPKNYREIKPIPDKILIHGEAFKEAIISKNNILKPENFVVTGFPRMSSFLRKFQNGKKLLKVRIREKIGIKEDDFLITVTSGHDTSRYLSPFLEKVISLSKDFIICIKLHIGEVGKWEYVYKNIANHPRIRIISDNIIDLYDLLFASDVHATVYSTVHLECLALGIPNVIIKIPGYISVFQLANKNDLIYVRTALQFVKEIKKLQENENYRNRIIERGKCAAKRFFYLDQNPEDLMEKEIMKIS